MRRFSLLILVLVIFSSFSVHHGKNALPAAPTSSVNALKKDPIPVDRFVKMKLKEAEKILGRKFTLKEKIAFKIMQLKIRKGLKPAEEGKSSKGQTAFILSLIGLCIIIFPYLSIASLPLAIIGLVMGSQAKRENPNDRKAQTAIILSLVTLGLFVLAVLLLIAVLSSGGFWV